jgi:hypothetical protein
MVTFIIRRIALLFILAATAHAEAPCDFWPTTYTRAGRQFCVRHRIALITVRGFSMSDRNRTTIIDPAENEQGTQRCNPNSIADYFSLRRTKLIAKPYQITYCKRCEAAMHTWRLRHFPEYRSYDSGGSYIKRL